MLPSHLVVDLSRTQFAFTALFHFLFVPLTLGLTWLLVIMEGAYLKTGKVVYKDMTQFWGKLLAINFAMGVVTGITLEFEFGQNWAYFSRMIGGSFGPILAIEGITAFMLEATMFGLFFFGWNKLKKGTHFMVTLLMALGASLSIVNILAANSWMQMPRATYFDPIKMALQMNSISMLYLNKLAQVRIGHVAFGGFITAAMFVMGISAFYLLRNRHSGFAKRSFAAAVGFGLICGLMVFFYGDQNGLVVAKNEPEKMAAIEAQWQTQKAPASWVAIAFPSQSDQKNYFAIKIPYMLSIIATHSLTGTVEGVKEIIQGYESRVRDGIKAYQALMKIRLGDKSAQTMAEFKQYQNNIGFGFIMKKFNPTMTNITDEQIKQAATFAIPQVSTAFWAFRVMLGCWGLIFLLMITGFYYCLRGTLEKHRFFLRCSLYAIPLPYLAAEAGWVLAETGRQPWTVHYYLPTFMSTSSVNLATILTSLSGFIVFYFALFCVEIYLMFKYARLGPSCLGTGRYLDKA